MQWDAILSDLATAASTDDVRLVSSRTSPGTTGRWAVSRGGTTQALVPGIQVIVAVAEVQYDYRFGRSVTVLCERA